MDRCGSILRIRFIFLQYALMEFLKHIQAVIAKDLRLELRTKYALNTVLAFVASALLVTLFTLSAHQLAPEPQSGLLWIIILFAALSILSRSFVAETEKHTFDLLRLHSQPLVVYSGKLIFNFIFSLLINIITFLLFLLLVNLEIYNVTALLATLIGGTAGIAGVTTLMAAIVAKADRRGAIFSVVSLPLLIPLILIATRTTQAAVSVEQTGELANDAAALIGYVGVTVTAGILLFDYIWYE